MPELPVQERIYSFIEVDQALTEDAASGESSRCLSCCLTCYDPDSAVATIPGIKDSDSGSKAA